MKALKTKIFENIRNDSLGREALKQFASSDEEKYKFTLSTGKKYIIISTESNEFKKYYNK